MTISDAAFRVQLTAIWIDRAQRARRVLNTTGLKGSLRDRGQINPIVVRQPGPNCPAGFDFELVAGECRMAALQEGVAEGWHDGSVLCRLLESLDPREAELIELEENLKRKDFEWEELSSLITRIHERHLAIDSSWTQERTAEVCNLSPQAVSKYLRVAEAVGAGDERVAAAGGMQEAYNILLRQDKRRAAVQLEALLGAGPEVVADAAAFGKGFCKINPIDGTVQHVPAATVLDPFSAATNILNLDFCDWVSSYSGQRFNVVHCDFPYGVSYNTGAQGKGSEPSAGYSDDAGAYKRLLEAFCANIDRFMSLSSHLMFWYTAESTKLWETLEYFRVHAPSLRFAKQPLIWHKSDNAGVAPDPRRTPRHTYELCLFASRGDQQLVLVKADSYSAPTDHTLHPSCKPRPVLRHFMEMMVDRHTRLLDPTCGSGTSLQAAESFGAEAVLGLELNAEFAAVARKALEQQRRLEAAGGLSSADMGL